MAPVSASALALESVQVSFQQSALPVQASQMDRQLKGFASPDAVLIGAETRSSSPVRMLRGTDGMAEGLRGLYPAGEGAGYAGGIMSAAADGITQARRALENACP